MTTQTCSCGKPVGDTAYVCGACQHTLTRTLAETPWLAGELNTTLTRQKGIDYRALGTSPSAEAAGMVAWHVSAAADAYRGILASWVRLCLDDRVRSVGGPTRPPADDLPAMSRWLMCRVPGLAAHPAGGDAVQEIVAASRKCVRLIDSAPEKWYAGPCNNPADGAGHGTAQCGTDLYARSEHGKVTCTTCDTEYDVAERRAWLLEAAEDRLADATTLARSVSWLGALPLTPHRIHVWANRGRIVAKAHLDGRPLYRIGDAIDLMAESSTKTRA